jgi:FeS assembly SUF system protein
MITDLIDVHLPVLPTGRQEALRRTMHEQATTPPPGETGNAATPGSTSSPPAAPAAESTPPASAAPSPAAGSGNPATSIDLKLLEGRVIEALRQIYDPEIPVNIYELGLIYNVDVKADKSVQVTMTLTAPACPVAGTLPGQVEKKIEEIPEVTKANVELVWEPPWCREMMSEAAQLQLGFL